MTQPPIVPEEGAPKPQFYSLRPPLFAVERGMVVAGTSLGSAAGAEILRRGGTATDAAIAASAVQAVVMPHMGGPGGDLFLMHLNAQGTTTCLLAAGAAPGKASLPLFQQGGASMPQQGILSVSVPGLVGGWFAALQRFGRLSHSDVFGQAIEYAEKGFPLHKNFVRYLGTKHFRSQVEVDEGLEHAFGRSAVFGAVHKQPQLAQTLRELAAGGEQAFYRGPIAKVLSEAVERRRGLLNLDDLARFEPEWAEAISIDVWNWRICQTPPPSQGIAMLEILKIAEQINLNQLPLNSREYLTQLTEIMKFAHKDRDLSVCDPRFAFVDTNRLLSASHTRVAADAIRRCGRVTTDITSVDGSTTCVVAADASGNAVALMQSLGDEFGSGIYIEELGIALQNRMKGFTLEPNHPNCVEGGKRPLHTLCPSAAISTDGTTLVLATPGGATQPQTLAQVFMNLACFGLDIQEAIESPRISVSGKHVLIEDRLTDVARALGETGTSIVQLPAWSSVAGGCAGIQVRPDGVRIAGADPRRDSYAIPQ
jgi:gamma-glutamyltranspeptidase/glutathione hydrolase